MGETEEVTAYTAYEAAQDSIAGASLVAWPPSNYPTKIGTIQIPPGRTDLVKAMGRVDEVHEQGKEERGEEVRTGPYLALEAALDARRGACFVAWPTDEEWRVPTLCV